MWKEIRSLNIGSKKIYENWQPNFVDCDEINQHFINIIPNLTGNKEKTMKFYSEMKFCDNKVTLYVDSTSFELKAIEQLSILNIY